MFSFFIRLFLISFFIAKPYVCVKSFFGFMSWCISGLLQLFLPVESCIMKVCAMNEESRVPWEAAAPR